MSRTAVTCFGVVCLLVPCPSGLLAQKPPYDVFPPADPPYYRVRYEALEDTWRSPYRPSQRTNWKAVDRLVAEGRAAERQVPIEIVPLPDPSTIEEPAPVAALDAPKPATRRKRSEPKMAAQPKRAAAAKAPADTKPAAARKPRKPRAVQASS